MSQVGLKWVTKSWPTSDSYRRHVSTCQQDLGRNWCVHPANPYGNRGRLHRSGFERSVFSWLWLFCGLLPREYQVYSPVVSDIVAMENSSWLIGQSLIDGPFSIATLNYQRVVSREIANESKIWFSQVLDRLLGFLLLQNLQEKTNATVVSTKTTAHKAHIYIYIYTYTYT